MAVAQQQAGLRATGVAVVEGDCGRGQTEGWRLLCAMSLVLLLKLQALWSPPPCWWWGFEAAELEADPTSKVTKLQLRRSVSLSCKTVVWPEMKVFAQCPTLSLQGSCSVGPGSPAPQKAHSGAFSFELWQGLWIWPWKAQPRQETLRTLTIPLKTLQSLGTKA